jgi:hypothetical protein
MVLMPDPIPADRSIMPDNAPHNALRHHVSGAVERGEAEPITAINTDAPHIYWVRKRSGIAGQYAITARVGYPDEAPRDVTFIGSVYGGPVIMRTEVSRNVSTLEEAQWWETKTVETFVTDPARFGDFGEAWVRAFFAAS